MVWNRFSLSKSELLSGVAPSAVCWTVRCPLSTAICCFLGWQCWSNDTYCMERFNLLYSVDRQCQQNLRGCERPKKQNTNSTQWREHSHKHCTEQTHPFHPTLHLSVSKIHRSLKEKKVVRGLSLKSWDLTRDFTRETTASFAFTAKPQPQTPPEAH